MNPAIENKPIEKVRPRKYPCEYCSHVDDSKEALEIHERMHVQPLLDKYNCKLCGDLFLMGTYLRRHTRLYHKPMTAKLTCDQCGKPFRKYDERELKKQNLVYGIVLCKACYIKKDN